MLLNVFDTFCEEYANIIVFCLNILVLVFMVSLYFYIKMSKKKWNKMNDYLGDITKTVNSIRYGDLTKKIKENSLHHFILKQRFYITIKF